ncbi:hypothetical protein DCAR_0623090 [Daucus carota subsp. sativus]|uniref:DUF4283 domain-containing protein n=1 Tax=Daucus carota subsp. sativus TaxID=79200 RepID=A0AAF0XCB6_DAUCS|nr:hypothetical protein DCAR_0623090 [Daucus carota subsp. sativus]
MKNINFQAIQNVVAAIWRPKEGIEKVIDGGPWTFEQSLLVYHKLEGYEDAQLIKLNNVEIWVQVYDLPSGILSK